MRDADQLIARAAAHLSHMSTERPIRRAGTVVRYTPFDPAARDPRWCREGIAIADDRGYLVDTYWESSGDQHVVTAKEADSIEDWFHLEDVREIGRHTRDAPTEWLTFAPTDRYRVTSQHGCRSRFYVRLDAAPDLATQIANAQEALDEAERALRSAQSSVSVSRGALAALLCKEALG